jgi:hypothetical protein
LSKADEAEIWRAAIGVMSNIKSIITRIGDSSMVAPKRQLTKATYQ